MKQLIACLLFFVCPVLPAISQEPPLHLIKTIPLFGVTGKFDHFAFDEANHRLFIAATGNHSVEVLDVQTGKTLESIKNLGKPHGLAWVADSKRLFVADGTLGALKVYSGSPLALVGDIKLSDDADDMAYDASTKLLYVGHGGSDAATPGRIAVIDTTDLKLVDNLATAAHPEALEIDEAGDRIFANIADAGEVAVVDGHSHAITQHWPLSRAKNNVPLAWDSADGVLLLGCRMPAKFLLLDGASGKELVELPASTGSDDLFYDATTHRAFLIAGSGSIDVYQVKGKEVSAVGSVHTTAGAKTALLVPSQRALYVGEPGVDGKPAQIAVYSIGESK